MRAIKKFFSQHGQQLRFRQNATILPRGEKVARVYLISSGRVLLHSTSFWGREIGHAILEQGEAFGMTNGLRGSDAMADGTALTDCVILAVDARTFRRAVRTDEQLAREVMSILFHRIAVRTHQIEERALHDLASRLARWLIASIRQQGVDFARGADLHIEFSQKVLAAMSGVSRETLCRQLRSWSKAGMIRFARNSIHVLDPEALAELADIPKVAPPRKREGASRPFRAARESRIEGG